MKNWEDGYEGRYYGTDINPKAGIGISFKENEQGSK